MLRSICSFDSAQVWTLWIHLLATHSNDHSRMFLLTIVAISVLLATISASAIINKEVSRIVDASTSVVRVTTSIKAANVDGEYQLVLPNALATHLAHMAVTSKGNALSVSAPVM